MAALGHNPLSSNIPLSSQNITKRADQAKYIIENSNDRLCSRAEDLGQSQYY